MTDLPDGYYAVPDPDDTTAMTYWRAKGGGLHPHPAKTWYGPARPLRQDAPSPKGGPEFQEWMRDYFDRWTAWARRVRDSLAIDPAATARRFADLTTRCCVCGRALTDAESKVLGIGPDCRSRLDPHGVAAIVLTPEVAKAHAAALLTTTSEKA